MAVIEIISEMGQSVPAPVAIPVAGVRLPSGLLALREEGGSRQVPAQRDGDRLVAIVGGLQAGKKTRYTVVEAGTGARVSLKETGSSQLAVTLPEGPFATYNFDAAAPRPFLYPVIGPDGKPVTRSFPMMDVPEEKAAKDQDHPHHRSFWTAFDEVSGVDNWSEGPRHGYTKHKAIERRFEGPVFGGFTASSTWTSREGKPVLDERRTLRVYNAGPERRLLDYDVELSAAYEDVHYGDTKEGGILAWRVFHTIKENEGGRMENNERAVGEKACWGKPAAWLDYCGPIDGQTYGIAMMDHPGNTNHPCRWHARGYGLVGTNPFAGQKAFGNGPAGGYQQAKGSTLRFRYRVLIHRGGTAESRVDQHYHAWIQPAAGKVVG